MRKPFVFLLAAGLLVVAAAVRAFGTMEGVVGGKEFIGFVAPEALRLLYAALALFAIALVVAIHAAFRAWMHRAARTEPPAPPEEHAPATH